MTLTAWPIDGVLSDAEIARLAFGSLIAPGGGTTGPGGLELSQKATPNMSVIVKGGTPDEGGLWIPGFTANTGPYYMVNSANYECAIEAAGASLPRVDTIVARILDEAIEGSGKEPVIQPLKGKEESGASLGNLKDVATVPRGCYVLGYAEVKAKAASILTENIKNVAQPFNISGGGTHISWGVISSTGAVEAGSGDFTCVKVSTGLYGVTWKTAKVSAVYAVTSEITSAAPGTARVVNRETNGFEVWTEEYSTSFTPENHGFSFTATAAS